MVKYLCISMSLGWLRPFLRCKHISEHADASHIYTETANSVATVTQQRSCTTDELTKYTVTFTNSDFKTQVKENVKTADKLDHDMKTEWTKDATSHWHDCTRCDHTEDNAAHIPGAAATEEAAQTCTECGYELAAKLEHAPMLVEGYEATTTAPGKKDYYHCDGCGKNYADVTSMIEIEGDPEVWRVIPMIIAIVEGDGQEWTKGTTVDLTFKSNADFTNFTRVEVDNVEVAPENYTVVEGSTIVTLKASFLETLSVDEHKIVIVSANDVPEAKFTVKAAATGGNTGNNVDNTNSGDNTGGNDNTGNKQNPDTGATSPQTGDNSNMFLWIALLFVSLGGLTTTVVYKKRKAVEE